MTQDVFMKVSKALGSVWIFSRTAEKRTFGSFIRREQGIQREQAMQREQGIHDKLLLRNQK